MVKIAPPLVGGRGVDTPNGDGEDAGGTGDVLDCPNVNAGAALLVWGSPVGAAAGETGWLPPKLNAFEGPGFDAGAAAGAPNVNGWLNVRGLAGAEPPPLLGLLNALF